jgi:hypothetical protein
MFFGWATLIGLVVYPSAIVSAQEIHLLNKKPDPFGYPRPARGATHVPVDTSFFFQLGFADEQTDDDVLLDSVTVQIQADRQPPREVLRTGQRFCSGFTGKIFEHSRRQAATAVYFEVEEPLQPGASYRISVGARSHNGAVLPEGQGDWSFTTAQAVDEQVVKLQLDLETPGVVWHGGFFTGFCKPSFCTSASNRIPGYDLMSRIRRKYPRAWSLQRDTHLTALERQPRFLINGHANVVRERETRRIRKIDPTERGVVLHVEDFFGHQQYGIASNPPLADDYHAGDEVLIADGVRHERARVLEILHDDQDAKQLLVTTLDNPAATWQLDYARPLPEEENPDMPGRFAVGGCYLTKFQPPGTPHFYWGRVNKEWDIAHRRFGRRLVVNFMDAPGDLSVDGGNWTYPKDYVEHHHVIHAYTTHLIDRYGDACLDFYWSVFNEPDLAAAFWRSGDWEQLQRFYDYTVDAILRAFEDRGLDSERVIVGGLEIGAIFGVNIERPILRRFLVHCSPTAADPDAVTENMAYADARLAGKRSRRVERLCRESGGRGSPCDFISVHAYNASSVMAGKLIRAKEIALDVDADYYADLRINSHESCPAWAPPPDVAAADSYLGNGYFPTWCADVIRRQLAKAVQDPRFAYGESIITFWPWPNANFGGHNNATRVIAIDEDGDGRKDREDTIAMPILHFLALVSGMGGTYQVLPEQKFHHHTVSGFASRGKDSVQVLLYSHEPFDVQSRSRTSFHVSLPLQSLPWSHVRIHEYAFDQDRNSYYHAARRLRDREADQPDRAVVAELMSGLRSDDRARQLAAIEKTAALPDPPQALLIAALRLYESTQDATLRAAIEEAGKRVQNREICYTLDEFEPIRARSELQVTGESQQIIGDDGGLQLETRLPTNGAVLFVIEPTGE